MNEALSVPRALGFWGVLFAGLGIVLFGYTPIKWTEAGLGLALCSVLMTTSWIGSARGTWTGWSIASLVTWIGTIIHSSNVIPDGFAKTLPVLNQLLIGCMAVSAATLLLSFLMGSASSAVFSSILVAGGLAIWPMFREKFFPTPVDRTALAELTYTDVESSDESLILDGEAILTQAGPMASQMTEWSTPSGVFDKELEHRVTPSSVHKTYYLDNPRGTFDEEPFTDSLDMQTWMTRTPIGKESLRYQPDTPPNRMGSFRLLVEANADDGSGQNSLQLDNKTWVMPGADFVAMLRARCRPARDVAITVTDEMNELSSVPWQIGTEWEWITVPFGVPEKVGRVVVRINNIDARAAGTVEIEQGAVTPLRLAGLGLQDLRRWQVPQGTKARARLEEISMDRCRLSVEGSDGDAFSLQWCGDALPIEEGKRYRLSFSICSKATARVAVLVRQSSSPWDGVGLQETLTVGPEPTSVDREFTALRTEAKAQLTFALGSADTTFTIEKVSFRPAEALADWAERVPRFARPRRYSMSYQTNREGFRDREHNVSKPTGTFRIAFIGDSVTFGQGVRVENRFSSLVERELNHLSSEGGPRFEALNFGVCGYSTWQERINYSRFASKYQPDLVVVMMHPNDLRSAQEEREFQKRTNTATSSIRFFELASEEGFDRCAIELVAMDKLVRGDGAKLVVFPMRDTDNPSWLRLVSDVAGPLASAGIGFSDLGEVIVPGRSLMDLVVSRTDFHPNELSHRLATQGILEYLIAQGYVPVKGTPTLAVDKSEPVKGR
jgi:hypothetical protein